MRRPSWRIASALIASLGLVVLIASVAAGVFVYSMVRSTLIRQAMEEVGVTARSAGRRLAAEQRAQAHRSLSEDLADLATGGTYVMLTNAQGQFELSKGPSLPTAPMGGWARSPARGWFLYRGVPYAYARVGLGVDRSQWQLFVVRSEVGQAKLEAALGRILLLGGALLMVALLVGVLIVVREITQPLSRLRSFAARVADAPALHGEQLETASGLYEVDALTRAFNHMLERLEASHERERQFAGDAAHALRTPAQVIGGYLNTLAGWGQRNPAVRREALAALRREARGMQVLIQRLLTLSRLSVDMRPPVVRVPLAAFIEKILPDLHDTCAQHPLATAVAGDLVALADPDLLAAVLRILVENADAYADPGGPVGISARQVTPWVEIAVSNPGPPIPDDVRPHLFERFYRGRRSAASQHVGLGLAIADTMVGQMRGCWRVECAEGMVVFAVRLPGSTTA